MKRFFLPILLSFLMLQGYVSGQEIVVRQTLKWDEALTLLHNDPPTYFLNFEDAYCPSSAGIPAFQNTVFFPERNSVFVSFDIMNLVFDSTDMSSFISYEGFDLIENEINILAEPVKSRNQNGVHISFVPLVTDISSKKVYKLVEFEIIVRYHTEESDGGRLKNNYTTQSVFATGRWYKFSVTETGVYKITYNDLVSAGMNPAGINPKNLRLYGNGGGMLPEPNSIPRHDDLVENAIIVVGEEDGVFNTQDYILFFGQSPHEWSYTPGSQTFEFRHNIYSDHNYYFLTADHGQGKRIALLPNEGTPANYFVNTFDDYMVHSLNTENLMKSGRQWYGEKFDGILTRDFKFNFPNRVLDSAFTTQIHVAASSLKPTKFVFDINGTNLQANISQVSGGNYPPVAKDNIITSKLVSAQSDIDIKITYHKSSSPSKGWLDYIWIHAFRRLRMSGDQMAFRSLNSVAPGRVSEFRVANTNTAHLIWDVSDPANVGKIDAALQSGEMVFRLGTGQKREFIVFDPAKAYNVVFVENVANQNLHGVNVPDLLIVTHPLFLDEARRLATFHKNNSGIDTLVVTIPLIYNEFSSGKQDVTAIRDFARMLYERDQGTEKFRYLLIFGDASYDYKDRIEKNTNFVPGWMSYESLEPVQSYITDDYYGFLDISEGGTGANIIDLGIGRLPAGTVEEAAAMVNKIIYYSENSEITMGDWRNNICLIADDEDSNIYIRDSEILAKIIDSTYSAFNLSKIYLDAYTQVSVPGGNRYPEVNADINKEVQRGALIVNYIGHGGILGLAHERVLEIVDIKNWTNYDRMTVFITATCEFAYFDDPSHTSPGELVLLNPNGGGIALFTTTRPTYATYNFSLNKRMFENSFRRINGEYPRLGDIMRLSKQHSALDLNARKFVLLGDPVVKINIPSYDVKTTHVNETEIGGGIMPIMKALSMVNIKGNVTNFEGNVIDDFNGTLVPVIFDKSQKVVTLANDGGETYTFEVQENIVYKGKVSIENGEFDFSFIVPKDIAYIYGSGKINYYASDGKCDAHGSEQRIIIGGYNEAAALDTKGPEIDLYINDENFESGGITDQNPILLAVVSDESGINTTGIGIGHDITAVLDHETEKAYLLNDFYQSDLDTYQSGTIRYPFYKIPDGHHHLKLKVWDIYNNPGEKSIEFVVASSGKIALQKVFNFPNPFHDRTKFMVEHNQAAATIYFEVNIYSLDGRLRKTFKQTVITGNYRSVIFDWDGRGDDGQYLERGTYVYKVIMQNPDTGYEEKGSKLVIIR